GGLSRTDVLLRAEAGGAADLLLSAVHRALLVGDRALHLGRSASPALHRAAGLGADPGHGHVHHSAGAQLGRHDQRHDDAVRGLRRLWAGWLPYASLFRSPWLRLSNTHRR